MTDGTNAEVVLLRAKVTDLESRLAAVSQLESRLAALEQGTRRLPDLDPQEQLGRRAMFKKLGIVAAGAAGASVLASARPAAAADGDPVRMGQLVQGNNYTKLVYGTGGSAASQGFGLLVADSAATPDTAAAGGRKTAVFGNGTGAVFQVGVTGMGTATGVAGQATGGAATGVAAMAMGASSVGLAATGDNGAKITARTNHLKLTNDAAFPIARPVGAAGAGSSGQIKKADDHSLWYCVGTNNWRELAGPNTAGSFHPITPTRAFDSRSGGGAPIGVGATNQRTVSLATQVPAGARAVTFSLTTTQTTGSSGYAAAIPGGTVWNNTSNINWFGPGQNLATSVIVGVNAAREIILYVGENPTHLIVDVSGYWL